MCVPGLLIPQTSYASFKIPLPPALILRTPHFAHTVFSHISSPVAYRGGELWGIQTPAPPPEIPKALQNRAKLNPIAKTVKNC